MSRTEIDSRAGEYETTTLPTTIQVGNRRLYLSPVIQQWLADPPRSWDTEGVLEDLRNLAECNVWNGRRRNVIPYSYKRIMDRLEVLQAQYPRLNLFAGVFPRNKRQPCTQILWYDATQMGTEDELAQHYINDSPDFLKGKYP